MEVLLENAIARGRRVKITFQPGYGWVTGPGPLEVVTGYVGRSSGPQPCYILLRYRNSTGGYALDPSTIVRIEDK